MGRHTAPSISGRTIQPLQPHVRRWPEFPEFARQNFRNPHGGSYPLLDAYESLKMAAKTAGAPLCGTQRVWIENHNVYVVRDSGRTPELLGAIGSDAWGLNVYHGGKWIDYQTDAGIGHFRYDGTHWVATDDFNVTDLAGGSYASSQGVSHDWNAGLTVEWGSSSPNNSIPPGIERVTVSVSDSIGGSQLATFDVSAGSSSHRQQTRLAFRAYPQMGDTAYFALSRMRTDITYGLEPCTDDRGIVTQCVTQSSTRNADTSLVYKVNVHGGPPVVELVRSLPDTLVYSMSLSENGRSSAMALGSEHRAAGGVQFHDWCQVHYLDGRFGGLPQRTIVTSDACPYINDVDGSGGGFSANRVPARSSLGRHLNRVPPAVRAANRRHSTGKLDR